MKLPIITSLSGEGRAMLGAHCQCITPAEQGKRLTNRLTKRLTRRRRMSDFLTRRNGIWYFVRRVPATASYGPQNGEPPTTFQTAAIPGMFLGTSPQSAQVLGAPHTVEPRTKQAA